MSLSSLLTHRHVRPGVSRRRFLRMSAATGAFLGSGLLPRMAGALGPASGVPQPIPPGFLGFRIWLPEPAPASNEQASITDFNGSLGIAVAGGHGTGDFGEGEVDLLWHADIRLMDGVFIDEPGKHRRAEVGFF